MVVIKDFYVDRLRVRVFDTRAEMGACAGTQAAQYLREVLAKKGEANVMFAAAPSQNETLAALCADTEIDWKCVNAFHMDEYVGLDQAHPAGFRNFLRRAVFDKFPFRSINLLNGNAPDAHEEAQRYAALLQEYPLDICLLGVGENGHIAFNDPPVADFNDSVLVKVVELEQRCRMQQVNDGCFEQVDDVPTHALTVTMPGLTGAKRVFCAVPAATKADAIRTMLSGEVSTQCPASILTTHPSADLYVDIDAGRDLL